VVNILQCLITATLLLPVGVASAATSSVVNLPVTITALPSVENDEFVGPFPSWANMKTHYGAVGNGFTDDTAAIQTALNALGPGNPILYFPAGTYKITNTLSLSGQSAVGIIGADPTTTAIVWAGSSGGTMLYINGVKYSRFDRLTFNGQGNAAVAVDQSKADDVNCCFDTGNQYADNIFENAGIGFRCGNLGFGCADTTMLRNSFVNNTVMGILMKNFNALDLWVWYSTFQNNWAGIGNYVPGGENGAGEFHVYNSIFQNSEAADIAYGNIGVFNFVNNYSIGSKKFVAAGGSNGSDQVLFQRNTILDTTQTQAIVQDDRGPVILLDNVIRSASSASYNPSPCDELGRRAGTCPVVMVGNFNVAYPGLGYDLFSMGNTFTLGSGTCSTSSPAVVNGRCHSINDQIVSRASINPNPPILPGTPPNLGRTIYEASPTGSGTVCSVAAPCSMQQAITNAAVGCSNNVAHMQPGDYSIASTITVPPNCAIQIIGDSNYSRLRSAGANPVMRLLGPSLATLSNFEVDGIGLAQDGIEIDNVDAGGAGGRVFVEGGVFAGSNINVFTDCIDYANVELHNSQNLYNNSPSTGGMTITSGAHGGQFNQYLGLSASLGGYSYSVSGSANVNINGIWNETPSTLTNLLNVTGAGTVTYSGSFFNVPSSSPGPGVLNSANFTNFTGTAGLVGLYGQTEVDPDRETAGAAL
jgi:hypothetical protein